jgi:CubicO group peptidase (beta-lactamase class C family)
MPVTLGDLATHVAGLPKMPDDLVSTDLRDPEAGYTAERLDAFLARYDAPSPPFGYRYSNVGFAILGQGLAERSDLSYGDLLRVRIIEPLGMTATGLAGSPETLAPIVGHDDQMVTTPPFSAGVFSPAGGAISTAAEARAS